MELPKTLLQVCAMQAPPWAPCMAQLQDSDGPVSNTAITHLLPCSEFLKALDDTDVTASEELITICAKSVENHIAGVLKTQEGLIASRVMNILLA